MSLGGTKSITPTGELIFLADKQAKSIKLPTPSQIIHETQPKHEEVLYNYWGALSAQLTLTLPDVPTYVGCLKMPTGFGPYIQPGLILHDNSSIP